jgi:hypothetical protein
MTDIELVALTAETAHTIGPDGLTKLIVAALTLLERQDPQAAADLLIELTPTRH